ncbi:hypothetical protein TREMEDRAFT_33875 [Tremella mesenterica DSM 1558]|uniref:uncharacterized protein n=1 Tax=Tremella mesenterica (strain ATCC 24925 / CBS 8224 / DSM 1558 / NBRC 9311 / NRRL Y-6157 / RJB 2259-6 / UBC 559-6) TaxID=578456 RepID=UPI0003F49D9D|nr:uncharacterized protein TREMEDRAFT_33875 [Tremella mesenterica DSM 1558]EIW67290.1 hypothetical protein TREMEDRAFT_33875 [Tremella mesenterica DSM 1558]
MSWLGWGSAVPAQYEELVEKACSPLNLPYPQSEDMATALEITDMIRSKAVQPKPAMQSLKRRVGSKNGRVQMYALSLIDTCIKNGGDHFLAEIASKEFVDEISAVIEQPGPSPEVKQMALRMFQSWAIAFMSKKELSFVVDKYNEMKNSGIKFPPPPDAQPANLLETTTAPAWVDSDVCMRCRSAFTFTNRKHHCRNCGLVYDQACSSRSMPLPRYGIVEPVRVCESCWVKGQSGKPNGPPPTVPGRTPRTREDLDADLQRAIELSLAESHGGGRLVGSEPPIARRSGKAAADDDDEQLRLAIEASLRDMEARPSAPIGLDEPEYKPLPTFDLTTRETETILTFSNTLEQMAAYGERDLRRFPQAHVLYEQAYALGGKLQRNAEEKTTKQQMLMEMQDKLSQAITLYGQILDGQQAYAARKLQEEQHKRYQQYYNPQYAPQYGYNPQSQATSSYSYAPPQQAAYQSLPSQSNGLYPNMPNMMTSYQPFQPQMAPKAYTYNSEPVQTSQQAVPVQSLHNDQTNLQRQVSVNSVQGYSVPSVTQEVSAPPVDITSHPSASPQSSKSPLPIQRSASYSSSNAQISSPTTQQYLSQLQSQPPQQYHSQPQFQSTQSYLPQSQPPQLQAQYHPPQLQPQPPLQQQQQQTQPSQPYQLQPRRPSEPSSQVANGWQPSPQMNGYQPHVYSASSFPSAPPAFPDAPQDLPTPEAPKEALLIEL